MIDIDEIMNRAKAASEKASKQLEESMEKSRKIAEQAWADDSPKKPDLEAQEPEETQAAEAQEQAEAQAAANQQRQVEILGQIFSPEAMAQMASNEAMIQKIAEEKAAEIAAGITSEMTAGMAAEMAALGAESVMEQLFGEDMGLISAALETLALEEDEAEEGEGRAMDLALEQEFYCILEDKLAQIDALPEPEPVTYTRDDPRWKHFGILLSGILSNVNDHQLDGMDVEAHVPVLEQQIASLVRRSWGINGRGELLDTIRYLKQDGYTLRYQMYCEAESPEELMAETDDEDERQSICRGWRFAHHYKSRFAPEFMTGWDVGRAAMLARWGCYLGWITEGEATGILWELSGRAVEDLHSWREFAESYLFGALMWKLLCGDCAVESYLSYLADSAADLLTGPKEIDDGQWRDCPWPAPRKIGFSV